MDARSFIFKAIIALALLFLILALTMPSLQRAKEQSRSAVMMSIQKQRDLQNLMKGTHINLINADEVWVIAKPSSSDVEQDQDSPGSGAMLAKTPEKGDVPLPLKHTDVRAEVIGYIATVHVTQQFHNPFNTKIEAEYVFPLPQNAAVNDFIMTIGERTIRGIIREREEAERIYHDARAQGHVASLLTQERPNIFTQKVANIEPGKQIDVDIHYFNTLAYADGWYEFVFPMVVGPRYNPPHTTDGVGAVARSRRGVSGQNTEIQYLAPNERSSHDISLMLTVDAGVKIEEIVCNSHVVETTQPTHEKAQVRIADTDTLPNKDFVLRYRVAGKRIKSALVTHHDRRGGYFSLMLHPPADIEYLKRAPMEMIFVLDCSGSMNGQPIAKAKRAIKRALQSLQKGDTFQVIQFSNNASQLGRHAIPATKENIRKGLRYVDQLRGSGGTEMIEGIKAALDFEHDPERLRLVSFMTDGFIGNETEILSAVHRKLGASRIFSFGIGSSVNRYLLDRLAVMGQGAVAYIGLNDDPTQAMDAFYQRISHPALTDVSVDFRGMEVTEMFPQRIPDLFVGRPVLITGRYSGRPEAAAILSGRVKGKQTMLAIPVVDSAYSAGIAGIWARKKIESLNNQATYDSDSDLTETIKQTALDYKLMSDYTAFVAVDSSRVTEGDHGVSVAIPVPVPEGVHYETTVAQ